MKSPLTDCGAASERILSGPQHGGVLGVQYSPPGCWSGVGECNSEQEMKTEHSSGSASFAGKGLHHNWGQFPHWQVCSIWKLHPEIRWSWFQTPSVLEYELLYLKVQTWLSYIGRVCWLVVSFLNCAAAYKRSVVCWILSPSSGASRCVCKSFSYVYRLPNLRRHDTTPWSCSLLVWFSFSVILCHFDRRG